MGKSTRTYEESIQEKDSRIKKMQLELKQQKANGKFFSKAMQKSQDTDTILEEVRKSGLT